MIASPVGSILLASQRGVPSSSTLGAPGVRRVGTRVEVHAGRASRGRIPQMLGGGDLLLLLGGGPAQVRCRGRLHDLPPALLSVVEKSEVLVLELDGERPYRAVHLPPGLLAEQSVLPGRAAAGAAAPSARIAWVATGPGLCELADDIASEDDVGDFLHCTLLRRLCAVRVAVEERVAHPVIHRVRDHIRGSFSRRVTIEELADMAGMCRFALVRAFAREIGIPPHVYQTHLRVQRARELIADHWPLSEVSLEVGFTDQSHLNRHFKRLWGITPGLYARAVGVSRAAERSSLAQRRAAPLEIKNVQELPQAVV